MAGALGSLKAPNALVRTQSHSRFTEVPVRRANFQPASKLWRRNRTQDLLLVAQLFDHNKDVGKNETWWLRKKTAVQALGILGGAGFAANVLPSLSLMGYGGDGSGNGDGGGGGGGGGGGNEGPNPVFDLAEDAEGYVVVAVHTAVHAVSCAHKVEQRY